MDMPERVFELSGGRLARIALSESNIFVDGARDDIEIEPFCASRLLIHIEREAFGRCVMQPVLDGEPVALGLGYLLALVVEEQLIAEPFGGIAAKQAADLLSQLNRG